MRTMLKVLLTCVLVMGVISCSSYMPTHYYLINTNPELEKAEERFPFTLEIANVRSPSRYQDRIFYRSGEYEVGFYDHSQWVEFPSEMVKKTLANALIASGLFFGVDSFGSPAGSELILRCEIGRFDQLIAAEDYFADCELTLELISDNGSKSIWNYRAKARVKQEGEDGFAAAMSEAVSRTIAEAIADMAGARSLKELAAVKEEKL